MDTVQETGEKVESKQTPAANIAPGTENAPHTGQIEPHSAAANALPNAGASGVTHVATDLSVSSVGDHELPLQATRELTFTENDPLPKNQHPNDVKFKVKYAANFKGEKNFPEGSVQVVSKESAEQFAKAGIGSIIK